ncbi:MAG TPA: serine/threonine-protein kinase [Blastocatellia bacterium]|nr:serine/threonine-protein kinase [Blastocatellia bacterium]
MSRANLLNAAIGEYRLVDFLGAGGMGEVYRAVHSKLGRVVAVKVLTQAVQSPSFNERFLNEARIQASLHHPNIATLYDFCEFNGQPCIIMEYVDGESLVDRIHAFGTLPVTEALQIFQAVVQAMDYVHCHGIVHRDIKSNNIKISSTGEVKLLDFGIAKGGASPQLTMIGSVIGTLHYLSPEQVRGGAADARCDIWALGVVLYEMVTGAVPFDATTIGELCDKIARATYTSAVVLNPSVPRAVDAIVSRCLKKNPADRYQTAGQLLRDVANVLTPGAAPPPLMGEKVTTTIASGKQHWKLVSAAAGVVLLLVLGFWAIWPSDDVTPVNRTRQSNTNTAAQSAENKPAGGEPLRSFQIDAMEGQAEVFIDGQKVGTTPYEFKAKPGQRIDVVLKREGFQDRHEAFDVTENKKFYTFSLKKKE